MTRQFKLSLLGYSRRSVHDYITKLNADFLQRLSEKEQEGQGDLRSLREEVERLRQENERLRAERADVAGALIDAKAYAADLMERAERAGQERRVQTEADCQAERRRVQEMVGRIERLHRELRAVLQGMDEELERYERSCQALQEEDIPEAASA